MIKDTKKKVFNLSGWSFLPPLYVSREFRVPLHSFECLTALLVYGPVRVPQCCPSAYAARSSTSIRSDFKTATILPFEPPPALISEAAETI